MHSQANELFATFWTDKIYLLFGSFKNLPRLLTIASVKPYLLKFMRSLRSLGFPKLRTEAAHQSVSIFKVF